MAVERLPELQLAVRAIRGVASAVVRWPDPNGPATLAVRFVDGVDRDAVAEEILRTMEAVAGLDRSVLEVRRLDPVDAAGEGAGDDETGNDETGEDAVGTASDEHDATAEGTSDGARPGSGARGRGAAGALPGPGVRGLRPVLRGLVVERADLEATVTVTLVCAERAMRASATGLATQRQTPRTAARAALVALQGFLPPGVRVDLDWLEVARMPGLGRPDLVHVAVLCLSAEGEDTVVGTAVVRGDAGEAAVRATLDALNRRLERPALPLAG